MAEITSAMVREIAQRQESIIEHARAQAIEQIAKHYRVDPAELDEAAEGMASYVPAEAFIADAWGRPAGNDSMAEAIDRLIRERLVTGNEIIVLVASALEQGREATDGNA